jgi:hypothetical protein
MMALSKLKAIRRQYYCSLMIILIVLNGCRTLTPSAEKSDYCDLATELDLTNPEVQKTYLNSDSITEKYIRVDQSTITCYCKPIDQRQKCFDNLIKKNAK